MKKEGDLGKTAILVSAGILVGVLIMLCIPHPAEQLSQKGRSEANTEQTSEATATDPSAEANAGGTPALPGKTDLPPSPYPVSAAMAQLNAAAQAPQTIYLQAPGTPGAVQVLAPQGYVVQAPVPGQTIIVQPGSAPMAGEVIQEGPYQRVSGQMHDMPALPVGRNGLLANPCADPGSVHGVAYNRRY